MRYLLGVRGPALTAGAVAPNAIRKLPEDVAAQIQSVLP
jgi:hypothetical protein